MNYDPDFDQYDIIAFLRENYDDANIIDKDEFNEHVESPEEEPEELEESLNESEKLDKVYKYYMNVKISTLNRSKTINKLFLSGYTGKHISYNLNADTPLYKAWKAGRDRKAAEENSDVEESFKGINGNGNILNNQDRLDPRVEEDILDDEDELNLKESHHIETLDEFVNETLKFSDGEEFDTQGKFRIEERKDGWYIIGEGKLIPVASQEEGQKLICNMKI